VFVHQTLEAGDFHAAKSIAARQAHRVKPVFGRAIVPFNMNMRRLIASPE